jgi:hypothetical protein
MKCTNCGLINPETAERCDCGYDFATQVVKDSYLPVQQTPSRNRWTFLLTSSAIFIAIGPLVGFIGIFFIQPIAVEGISSITRITTSDLRLPFGLIYASYIFGAIPAFCTGILYGVAGLILPHKIFQNFLWRAMLGGMIGAFSTEVFCHFAGLGTGLILWAGLPAGVICSLLPQNRPPNLPPPPPTEKRGGGSGRFSGH